MADVDEPCPCGHAAERHGPEAGGCIECRCRRLIQPTDRTRSSGRPMIEQFVVRHSEHKGLIGPSPTREAAWAWVKTLPPYPHAACASVLPVHAPV